MGFQLLVGGEEFRLDGFSVVEASTPLAATDSSGQVGTVNLTVVKPDPFVEGAHEDVRKYSPVMLVGKKVRLTDSRKGFTLGSVKKVDTPSPGTFTLSCESRLGELNVFNVQAQPFIGTLGDAFEYYVSLAGVDTDVYAVREIEDTPVVFPGWNGELWFHLKQMAAAVDADISLVSGNIILRPIRSRVAIRGRDTDRTPSIGGGLAQYVELYHYKNREITDELVYPPGGWSEQVTVIHVNAGEYVEETLDLSASVSSIRQPVMQTHVSRDHNTSSVYTVVGDDGLPIQPQAWTDYGGSLSVEIKEDTKSLLVKIMAPTGLPNKEGKEIAVFGIALSSDSGAGRYSTLRIVGSGVAFEKDKVRVATGVSAQETGTEVGATVDNPYLGSLEQVYRTGSAAARNYSGRAFTLSGSVIAVNELGDSGVSKYPSYALVQNLYLGRTYGFLQLLLQGSSYSYFDTLIFDPVRDEFENQVFGNVNGARVWDNTTHRWYRIREATLNPDLITFSADDDLIHEDAQNHFGQYIYSQIQGFYNSRTYSDADLMGLVELEGITPIMRLFPSYETFPGLDVFPTA